jgi:hypothetical protein
MRGHRLDGIVRAEAGGRLHDTAGSKSGGQQLCRLLGVQLAAVSSPRRPYAGAREQAPDCLDLPAPRRAQRTLQIDLLRDGIAVLNEIEPHGWHSPKIRLEPASVA